jgi:hypothetical protein
VVVVVVVEEEEVDAFRIWYSMNSTDVKNHDVI